MCSRDRTPLALIRAGIAEADTRDRGKGEQAISDLVTEWVSNILRY
jgi:hypothetical protein